MNKFITVKAVKESARSGEYEKWRGTFQGKEIGIYVAMM